MRHGGCQPEPGLQVRERFWAQVGVENVNQDVLTVAEEK